ncbi:MAG: gliding motility-associated C-terminal domain-containing protein [Pedobacter sp.]|nr:gliding motility-associated C-terminal domain-containing protein [Pedobacter sp.]MDQ8053170.1 gliding motility-associated C-terminal domain-containing protein [Pedobacter sp.]
MRKLFFLLFLFIGLAQVKAATFYVTATSDSGTGSLREAITLANANGTGSTDFIYFNLPGSTITDVTISLVAELPILTSNIIIDGTTQPFAALGHPDIKVWITRGGGPLFNGLRLENADHIEIYGCYFSGFISTPTTADKDRNCAIHLFNTAFITIGAPGKSNCFAANDVGILSRAELPKMDNSDLKISSNLIGLSPDGISAQPNVSGMEIRNAKNSIVGGNTVAEGNLITANTRFEIGLYGSNGTLMIANNVIGLDKTLATVIPSNAIGIILTVTTGTPQISNNIICAQLNGMYIYSSPSGFSLTGNRIGTGPLGTEAFGNQIGIALHQMNSGIIGGSNLADGNIIAYNNIGVSNSNSYPITMLKNSFYCNGLGIEFKNMSAGTIIPMHMTTITPTQVTGKYLPNSTIELFYVDSCPGCEGKTWIATIQADASGNWVYNGVINGRITGTGTNSDGATTDFSKPYIDDSVHEPQRTICGKSTGGITKMRAYDATVFQWRNADTEELVGTALDLQNVPAGRYYLTVSQGGNCYIESTVVEVVSIPISISENGMSIVPETCSGSNGSISGITVSNNVPRTWYNRDNGNFVANTDNLINVPTGRYYFEAGTGACKVISTTYLVPNNNAQYSIRSFNLKNATCGAANGKIVVVGAPSNDPFTFRWLDVQNNVVGNTETAENLVPGSYRLMVSTQNGCESEAAVFEILEEPLPTINYSAVQKYLSCDGRFVSTSGISINGTTGPYTYSWKDQNGIEVAQGLNLGGVVPGIYVLQVTDQNGCKVDGQFLDFTGMTVTALNVPNAFSPNGDGINDYWQIEGVKGYFTGEFSVYNRDGGRVFYSRGYTEPFDGRYKGKLLPTGTYYFIIDLKTDCPRLTGSLTILR